MADRASVRDEPFACPRIEDRRFGGTSATTTATRRQPAPHPDLRLHACGPAGTMRIVIASPHRHSDGSCARRTPKHERRKHQELILRCGLGTSYTRPDRRHLQVGSSCAAFGKMKNQSGAKPRRSTATLIVCWKLWHPLLTGSKPCGSIPLRTNGSPAKSVHLLLP